MPPFLTPPVFLILVLASIYSLIFYLLWGRRLRQLPLFWIGAVIGFFIGDILAVATGFSLLRIGLVHIDLGSIASWAAMFIVRRLRP
ncbi:MAG: hypothetical protein HYX86_04735 [Chloroflexi bacterium]|nr:hypothetical protein [Chloroflexota bacterium]